jgi:hypothetical protein
MAYPASIQIQKLIFYSKKYARLRDTIKLAATCLGSTANMAAKICLTPIEKVFGIGTVTPRIIFIISAGRVGA